MQKVCSDVLALNVMRIVGGASLSFHSLTAATLGAAACVPLLMLRARMWSSEACSQFPVLEELQTWQAEVSTPIVKNMTNAQVHTALQLLLNDCCVYAAQRHAEHALINDCI